MIDTALNFLLGELSAFLDRRAGGHENNVVLAPLATAQGGVPLEIDNKIVLTLVNLEKETASGAGSFVSRSGAGYARASVALHLNLYVLVSASYGSNYATALRMLSLAMGFLQGKPAYTPQNSAGFPPQLQQLTMEMVSLSMAELSTLWAVLGTSYLPSVVYKMRMVTLQEGWSVEAVPEVSSVQPQLGNTP
jgi:hypothetical protein